MMNTLSFPLTPAQVPGTSTTPAPGSDSNKPGDGAFKQLLDDSRVPAKNADTPTDKNIADKPRPAAQHTADTPDEASAREEPASKLVEAAVQQGSDGNSYSDADDDNVDAPWPPPGLPMFTLATAAPTAPDAATQITAALPMQASTLMQASAPLQASTLMPASAPMPATLQPTQNMAPAPATPPATAPAASPPGALTSSITAATSSTSEEAVPTTEVLANTPTNAPNSTTKDSDPSAPLPSFGHLLQGLATPAAAARVEPTPFTGALAAPVAANAPDFDEAIGARVGWLADQKIGHAHIRVTPNDMGPVEVRLQLDGDRVHANFTSAHADVRQALENSLPKLREMLSEQGLQLAHADVGQHSDPRTNDGNAHASANGNDAESGIETTEIPALTPHALRLRGLLDTYA